MKISVFTHTAFFLGGGVALEYESDTRCKSDNENKGLPVYNFTEKGGSNHYINPLSILSTCKCFRFKKLCFVWLNLIRVIIPNVKWGS